MASFVDTNVLVYAFDAGTPEKRARAQAILTQADLELVVSAQVLQEFYWVATRKLAPALPADVAREAVRQFTLGPVVALDAGLVVQAIDLARQHDIALWDAAIVVAAQRAHCDTLLTEDLHDGQAFGEVTVRNPFA